MGRLPRVLSDLSLRFQFTQLQVPPGSSPDRPSHLPTLPAPAQHPVPLFSHFTLNTAKWSPSPSSAPQLALEGVGGVTVACPRLVLSPIYSPLQFSALPPPAISRGPLAAVPGWAASAEPPTFSPISSFAAHHHFCPLAVLVFWFQPTGLSPWRSPGSPTHVSLGPTGSILCLCWSPLHASGSAGFGLSLKESCPAPLLESDAPTVRQSIIVLVT